MLGGQNLIGAGLKKKRMGKEAMETGNTDIFFEKFCSEGEYKNRTNIGGG